MLRKWATTEDFSAGYRVKRDVTQLPAGALVLGSQNVRITDGDRVGVRAGVELDGSASTDTTPIKSLHTFKKRDGTNIMMRSYGTVVEYRHPTLLTWQNLMTGMTSGQVFGFADHNVNTEFIDKVCFCNTVEAYTTWSGATTTLTSALVGAEATIPVSTTLQTDVYYSGTASATTTTTVTIASADWVANLWNGSTNIFYVRITSGAAAGQISLISATTTTQITFTAIAALAGTPTFEIRKTAFRPTTDMQIRIGTTTVTYTGMTDASFTGCSGTPAAASGAAVAQYVQLYNGAPRGNILLCEKTRMFVSGAKKNPQAVYYSKIADATDFTFSSPRVATDGGVIDNPEGGGAITGIALQEEFILMIKNDIIKTLTFLQDGTDLPTVNVLAQAPNVGANFFLGVFKIDNQVYYTSRDGGVKTVSRVENIPTMQALQLSDPISAYVATLDFTAPAGIFYRQKAYIACRSAAAVTANDVILVYNFQKQAWEPPIFGWNASAWTVFNGDLYFGSSLSPEIYKVNTLDTVFADNGYPYEGIARFAFNNYGTPELPKKFSSLFMEGYLAESTTITVRALYNYNGTQEIRETTIAGSDDAYIVGTSAYNMLGMNALGTEPLASNKEVPEDFLKFRVYFQTTEQPFYELSIEVSSNADGARWEILRFGTDALAQPEPTTVLKKKFA